MTSDKPEYIEAYTSDVQPMLAQCHRRRHWPDTKTTACICWLAWFDTSSSISLTHTRRDSGGETRTA